MRAQPLLGASAAAIGLLCVSCGQIGDTKPPALNIALPVRDLRVVEYGDRLFADFTIPPRTTEGLVLNRLGTVELRIGPGPNPFTLHQWAAAASAVPVTATATGPVHTDFPAAAWIGKEMIVAVRVVNQKGRASDWSNLVTVQVVPPVVAPSNLVARSDPKGARLDWQGVERSFRIFRKGPAETQPALVGSAESHEYIDASAQYGTEYTYLVQALRDRAESPMSQPVTFTPRDEFPPAVPGGLTAVAGVGSIELVWERNTEPDLRGYRVYRAVEAGPFERVSEFSDTPAYSDRQIDAGKRYRYAVSAVDQAGNESKMSVAAEVTAP